MGLNKYLDIQLPNKQLAKPASQLGSDVVFFLNGPLAFCTGKGEKIKKIEENFNFLTFLVLPGVSVSTKKVYVNYKHSHPLYEKLKYSNKRLYEKKQD